MLLFTSIISVITASTTKDNAIIENRMLRLINQRQEILPQDLLEMTASFIANRSDAQIWFESFEDPNERMLLFNTSTWHQLYQQCQGSDYQIAERLNNTIYFKFKFDKSSKKILEINRGYTEFRPPRLSLKSLNLNDLKQLRSLQILNLERVLADGQDKLVPDFKGWSDDLESINLNENGLIRPISFTRFPKKLKYISLLNNNGLTPRYGILLPGGVISYNIKIVISYRPFLDSIQYHGTVCNYDTIYPDQRDGFSQKNGEYTIYLKKRWG